MIKRCLLIVLCAVSFSGWAQSVASINYRYYYDAQAEVRFPMKVVNANNQLTVLYALQVSGAQDSPKDYRITWERHETYLTRTGLPVAQPDSLATSGRLSFPLPEKPWLLVARIFNPTTNRRFVFFALMDAKFPVDGYLQDENGIVFENWIKANKAVTVHGADASKPLHFYFYKTVFAPALPPFADKEPAPDRFLFPDSSFTVAEGQSVTFRSEGMYLAQQDTAAAKGFTIRVVGQSFPKYSRTVDIPAPLTFVSTKEEHDELVAAKDDKAKIDKVILDITGNRDRAKTFMKSYFRRVELANLFFTSYKEGWKTDRGMIFLIFGPPDEVNRTGANEIWIYRNIKERFVFLKSGSVYDPIHFTLMRDSKMNATWYSTIDLWRKAQF